MKKAIAGLVAGASLLFGWALYSLGKRRGKQKSDAAFLFIPIRRNEGSRVEQVGERIVVYVDVADMPPKEAVEHMTRLRKNLEEGR